MEYDYIITIKHHGNKSADRVSILMYVFALLIFSYFLYASGFKNIQYPVVIIFIIVAWVFTHKKIKKTGQGYYRWGLFIAAVGWLIAPNKNILMSILYAVAGLIEKQVKFPQEIGFSTDEISFNSLPKRKLRWSEVTNVMIRDGLLTIDQKNNKLYQKEIEGEVTPAMEEEFNAFSRERINLSASAEAL